MTEIWFAVLCLTLAVYAVLDGWNIGCGIVNFAVARTPAERRLVVAALGPLWSWHEVWLVAAGGVLFVAFPAVLSTSLSGFYLAVFTLLWCLVLRGIALEFGGHLDDFMWRSFWDYAFTAASALLAVLLGAALGNLLRGVPLDAGHRFTLPFFTNFAAHGAVGILDWYTLSIAAFTVACLAAHGASYLVLKTGGPVHKRSERLSRILWPLVFVLLAVVTAETAAVRPALFPNMAGRPVAWLAVTCAAAGMGAIVSGLRRGLETRAFLGSCAFIGGLLGAGAAGVFPVMLYSTLGAQSSVSAYAEAVSGRGLGLALLWWPFAVLLACAYFVVVTRHYGGKVGAS